MHFYQLDVFADAPYQGNPLAVFPDAGELSTSQMQAIAREMNLSETSFITSWDDAGYDCRIFTPGAELPFAGHPTIGSAWLMRHLGRAPEGDFVQRSEAGATDLTLGADRIWFERSGTVGATLQDTDSSINETLSRALSIPEDALFLEARELGRHGQLYAIDD